MYQPCSVDTCDSGNDGRVCPSSRPDSLKIAHCETSPTTESIVSSDEVKPEPWATPCTASVPRCDVAVSTPHSTGQPTVALWMPHFLLAMRQGLLSQENFIIPWTSPQTEELTFLLEPRHISKLSVMPRWACNVCQKCTDLYANLSSLSGVPFDVYILHIKWQQIILYILFNCFGRTTCYQQNSTLIASVNSLYLKFNDSPNILYWEFP